MKNSIFLKVFILIILTLTIVLGISFYTLKSYQENNLLKNLETYTSQISNTIKSTLSHDMLTDNRKDIQEIIGNVSRQKGIDHVFVLDKNGKIVFSPFQEEIGKVIEKNDVTCKACHSDSERPENKTIIYEKENGLRVFRNVNPIYSAPACHRCHDSNEKIRGILITDMPITEFEAQIASNMKRMFITVVIIFISLGTILYFSLSKLILNPLRTLVSGTKEISAGNFTAQISLDRTDEMGTLVSSFNSMTKSLKESRDELLKTIEEIKNQNKELTILYTMIQEITSTIEVSKLMNSALNIISNILETEQCYILTFNEKINTGSLNLKSINSEEIISSTISLPFVFDENIDVIPLINSEGFGAKLPFFKKISSSPYKEKENIISFPLHSRNVTIGIICAKKGGNRTFSEVEARIIESLSKSLAVSIQNSLLFEKASTDGLTGLFSKSYFENILDIEIERGKRFHTKLSLIILDIDDFKSINDTYGHTAGDEVIKTISSSIKSALRSIDIPCRFGGDEFTIILPSTDSSGSFPVAERIIAGLKKSTSSPDPKNKKPQVTISIGYASYPEDADNSRELLIRADEALYKAKKSGKNKVIAYNKD